MSEKGSIKCSKVLHCSDKMINFVNTKTTVEK